jgi:hypothetical protein
VLARVGRRTVEEGEEKAIAEDEEVSGKEGKKA